MRPHLEGQGKRQVDMQGSASLDPGLTELSNLPLALFARTYSLSPVVCIYINYLENTNEYIHIYIYTYMYMYIYI